MSWFATPLGLLGLLALPAVLALHLFRRRYRQVPVSALFLWQDPVASDSAGRVRQPLRRTPSFWLEMAAALLAALFLAGFDPLQDAEAAHLVAVLDDSASMGARGADGSSARDRAVERLEQAFDQYGRRTRVSLVRSGRRPSLLCGPGAVIAEARQALEAWQPAAPSHDLRPAMLLGRELAGDGELLVLSDRLEPELALDPGARWVALGEAADNLALLDASRTPAATEGQDRIQARVRSFAEGPRELELVLSTAAGELGRRALRLDAGGSARLDLEVPAATPALRLELPEDALAVDDHVVLHPPPRRPVRVGWALDEGWAEELGLDGIQRLFPDARRAVDQADLVIAHEAAAPPAWSLVLPRDEGELEAFLGPFLIEKRHPLLEGLTLDGLVWTRKPGFGGKGLPLIAAGDQALLDEGRSGKAMVYRLNLVPGRSTLQRSPDWPILLANLMALRQSALGGAAAVNLVAGEPFAYRHEEELEWQLEGPDGPRDFAPGDTLALEDLPPYGDYLLLGGGRPLTRFAVNFADPAESDLRQRGRGERSPELAAAGLARQRYGESPVGLVLLLLLLAAVLTDWWVLAGGGRRR